MSAITGYPADDHVLEELLGESPVRWQAARWGFDATTHAVTLASGRQVVMQVRPVGLRGGYASAVRATSESLRAAGIQVPRLVGATVSDGRELLVFELVPGLPGPELLADPARGPALAGEMGRLAWSLAAIATTLVPADDAWASPGSLRRAGEGWLDRLGRDAPLVVAGGGQGDAVAGAAPADVVAGALGRICATPWSVAVSHGDFVPANVLVADDGLLTLLDVGSVAARHPALDVAWWELIVRHHHADLAPLLINGLRTQAWASGVAPDDMLLASLAFVRALQLAADREPGDHRRHLLDLAGAAVAWSGSAPRRG